MSNRKVLITGLMNDEGENLLHYLCRTGDVSELLALHDFISDENRHVLVKYNKERQQCVHIIASQQEDAIEKMKLLALWGADLNAKELKGGDTPLHIAVRVKNYTLVEWLCQQPYINKEALNNDLMTPCHVAFVAKDVWMMNVLKDNGVLCRIPLQSETSSDEEDDEPQSKNPKYET
uniref:Viral ankyrin n=1 Tax=Glyptapanteles flavicoxis TaxID=463051 RepID=B7S8E5_9HYME|nr:viral ankyrin [Glyptapanteles flavicoxis]